MNRCRYANDHGEDRTPEKGDLILTPAGNKLIVDSYNPATERVMVGLAVYEPGRLFLHAWVR